MDWVLAIVACVGIGSLNNLLHVLPPRRRRVLGPVVLLGAAAAAAWWSARAGSLWTGLGAAVPWTLGALAATTTVVVVTEAVPSLRGTLADRRMAAMDRAAFTRHVLLRIPVLTALVEELLFRGALWVVLRAVGGEVLALAGTAVVFSLSHVAVAAEQARREGRAVVPWVAVTLAATAVAGLALGWLRLVTGGVWAPVGVHAAVNAVLAVGARRAAGRRA